MDSMKRESLRSDALAEREPFACTECGLALPFNPKRHTCPACENLTRCPDCAWCSECKKEIPARPPTSANGLFDFIADIARADAERIRRGL